MTRSPPVLLVLFLAAGCSRPASRTPPAGRPAVAVETTTVDKADLEQAVEVVGALSARSAADVRSEYSGTLAEVFVSQWVRVHKGTPLARLDTREAKVGVQSARAGLLAAEVSVQRAARELERTERLQEAGLSTRQAVDEAGTAREAARAAQASAQAQLDMAEMRLAKAVIRAPIDGVVSERNVNVGDFVDNMGNGAPMFRVVDARVLEFTASVPAARMTELAVGQRLLFSCDARPGEELPGQVSFVNPAADETSRTVKVKAEVPNPDEKLKPGLFAKGRIITGSRTGLLVVPRTALVSFDPVQRAATVFVVEGGVARRRQVKTGASAGDRIEVVEGLRAGQEIVTRGGFNLRDGDAVRAVEGA
ncbi:MAG TPA: efflux RND transporter periplasmic adaptor subunit [Anaeromyxobacter sp.]|nr:efflux RND transporter periplasmic adaptor subunit [Anaeromyxobacter sp.]